jgi:iron complex outermembrane recepter protein
MKIKHVGVRLNAIAVATLAAANFAQAQMTPILKETVVTASRMEQVIQSAPIGATVILGEDIRATGMTDANEAIRKLAGVVARSDQNGGRELSLDLRGFGDTAGNNMVVLVDGLRISNNELTAARLSAISPDMIDRIEIVRGSSSVVWGEGATAGVINVVTKPGTQQGLTGTVQVGAESYGGRDARAALNVGQNQARFFVQARSYHTDGKRLNSANTNEVANIGVELGESTGLKSRLSFFTENQRSRWPGPLSYAQYQAAPQNSTQLLNHGSQNEDRISWLTQYKTGAWIFGMDMGRTARNAKGHFDYGSFGDQDDARHTKNTQISPRVNYADVWGQTLVSAVMGMDRFNWSYQADTSYSGFLGAYEVASQKNQAHYLKVDFLFPTKTRLVVGKRHERVEKNYTETLASTAYRQNQPLNAWEIGLNQTVTSGWDAFGRVATSYRVANVDENRYLIAPLRPQTAKDHEIGLRYAGIKTRMSLRVFVQDTVDEIAYNNPTFSNVNLDPMRRRGVELDGQAELGKDWTLSGTIQALDPKVIAGANAGKTPPHVSKLNATARAIHAFNASHQIEMAVQKRGQAVLGNDLTNTCALKAPSTTTYDALYRFRSRGDDTKSDSWTILVGVDNVTNAKSFSWGFTNSTCSATNVYPDAGRLYKISTVYRF